MRIPPGPFGDLPRLPRIQYTCRSKADDYALISVSQPYRDGTYDTWVPCEYCLTPPLESEFIALIETTIDLYPDPWVPACPMCRDTGWHFSHCSLVSPFADLSDYASYPAR
jgi:hypothetical protein